MWGQHLSFKGEYLFVDFGNINSAITYTYPGNTSSLSGVVKDRDNVVRVPDHALRYSPGGLAAMTGERPSGVPQRATGSARVWILRDGRPAEVPVTIGLDDDAYAEVLSGDLKVGDAVVTSEQTTTAGSTTTPFRFFRL